MTPVALLQTFPREALQKHRWRHSGLRNRYGFDLAPGIRFVRPQHVGLLRQTLTLGETCAVASAFYAFQRQLLRGDAAA
jgi:hypothetical protein